MVSNVINLTAVRKIKQLEQSVKDYKAILTIKQTYLNNLSQFRHYDTIRNDFAETYDAVTQLMFKIGLYEKKLEHLRKEVHE